MPRLITIVGTPEEERARAEHVAAALALLREASKQLTRARAPSARLAVRRALASTEGAERHALRRLAEAEWRART